MNERHADQSKDLPRSPRPLLAALPNWLCWFRIAGSMVLAALAASGHWTPAWTLLLLLLLSDLVDGQIARRYSAESRHGALLDSVADIAMYAAVLIAILYYAPATVRDHWPWMAVAVCSYVALVLLCAAKFRRWPSYHTRLAKTGWLFILLALFAAVTGWAEWLILVAAIAVIVTNLESILITLLLPSYRSNIPSVLHVLN
jgi:cardiolipin synthase (CMP-forming)